MSPARTRPSPASASPESVLLAVIRADGCVPSNQKLTATRRPSQLSRSRSTSTPG
ncbi:hypothetical protein ACFQZ4_31160 [Catellatospora coxensis]